MTDCKKLIEVAMPIKEISAESVRDKSIRHGHISTLHLWWARRPLPVCRAIVFASLVSDPLDKNCPKAFKEAAAKLLADSHYKPYDDIPWTAAKDPMEDNLRNRLLSFIGKFSDSYISNEKEGKSTPAGEQLSSFSLIKWDNKNKEDIINKARKLIWVSHNADSEKSCKELLDDFESHYNCIKSAEKALYETTDRHIESDEVKQKQKKLETAIEAFLNRMPKVFDPFAGGGAIPLEASRLGCRSFGNDINPVAHIIQIASLEFPQKFGKPITYSKQEFVRKYGKEEWERLETLSNTVTIPNRLSFDVEFYSKKLLKLAEDEIGQYYPKDENDNKPIAYYWARTATCSNPSCKAEVPLLKQFYLCNKPGKKVYLNPVIKDKVIKFEIQTGTINENGWIDRGNLTCPCCGNTTDVKTVKQQFLDKKTSERLIAVICEGRSGKEYKQPSKADIDIINHIPKGIPRPNEPMPVKYTQALPSCTWGLEKWGQLFSPRQLLAMQTLVQKLNEIKLELDYSKCDYTKALVAYLAILIDRISLRMTMFGVWHMGAENVENLFGRQAISMKFEYPEGNPFCNTTSASSVNQLCAILRYIDSESINTFITICKNASSGESSQFNAKSLNCVVTDPPYYDAIAYADLSDFFYIWLKRTVGDVYPMNFAFPQTPKSEECTALKHHHNGRADNAKKHFENKLLEIFSAIQKQTKGIVSIMFAHQSTEAWTTLCNSVLGANLNISGSWAIDTEQINALKINKAFLSSSVTVACRSTNKEGVGSFKKIKIAIDEKVKEEVKVLYGYGFRGADLLTACFGQAVSEFGKYDSVEKADGTTVTVGELLEMTREAAFNAIISDIDSDDITRFYIGWLNLFGFSEAEHDDVMRITQVGLSFNVNDLMVNHIVLRKGNMESLTDYKTRIKNNDKLGNNKTSLTIDKVHKAMWLYECGNRQNLVKFVAAHANTKDNVFWRVLNSLAEILPSGIDDHKQVVGLLNDKDSLIKEALQALQSEQLQGELGI